MILAGCGSSEDSPLDITKEVESELTAETQPAKIDRYYFIDGTRHKMEVYTTAEHALNSDEYLNDTKTAKEWNKKHCGAIEKPDTSYGNYSFSTQREAVKFAKSVLANKEIKLSTPFRTQASDDPEVGKYIYYVMKTDNIYGVSFHARCYN